MEIKNEFIYPLKIQIEDTDFTGIVYHSNYLKFMERARSEWLEQLGYGMQWQREQQIMFVVYSANQAFLKPAYVHDQVEVVSKIIDLRPASITFDQHLRPANAADKILCKAEIKIACIDNNLRPRPLPESTLLTTIRRLLT